MGRPTTDKEPVAGETPPASIYDALYLVKRDLKSVRKDKTNPHFKSKFADINDVLEVLKEPLDKHGILLLQPLTYDSQGNHNLMTILSFRGQQLEYHAIIPLEKQTAQSLGSALTYMRRHTLVSLFGLEQEDDDGSRASKQWPKSHTPTITEPQRKRLFAIAKSRQLGETEVKEIIKKHGFESSKDIDFIAYEKIINEIEALKV